MKKINQLSFLTAIAILMLCSVSSQAKIWRVNNNPNYTQNCNHCFSSLQEANDTSLVKAGDTIHLEASNTTYTGPGSADEITINKHLVILGPGYFLSQNTGLQKNPVSATVARIKFDTGSDSSIMKGVRVFRAGGSDNITIVTGNILIENCYVYKDVIFGQQSNVVNVFIKKCYVNNRIIGTNATGNISNLIITNSFIGASIILNDASISYSGEISHCVIVAGGGSTVPINIRSDIQSFHNNIITKDPGGNPATLITKNDNGNNIHDNIFTDVLPNFTTGINNILLASNYVFVASGSQDSILNVNPKSICPECYTAAPGSATFGMFGGADPYKLSGIPNIPAIYQLNSPLNAVQGTPLKVNIGTRSNN